MIYIVAITLNVVLFCIIIHRVNIVHENVKHSKRIVNRIVETISKRVERKINKRLIAELDEFSLVSKAAKKRLHRELDGFAGIIANSNTQIQHYIDLKVSSIERKLGIKDDKVVEKEEN